MSTSPPVISHSSILLFGLCRGRVRPARPEPGGPARGISAFQFLKIGVGARGVAMGESFVASANDASALYWNPAALVQFTQDQAIAAHTEYLVDIKHEFFGVAWHLTGQDAVGVSFTSLHMKDMEITTETQPFGTGRYFSFGDIAVGFSYGRKMTDQFSFGATVKYVEETLDVLKMRSVMVDIGTWYWTGLGSYALRGGDRELRVRRCPEGNGDAVRRDAALELPVVLRPDGVPAGVRDGTRADRRPDADNIDPAQPPER